MSTTFETDNLVVGIVTLLIVVPSVTVAIITQILTFRSVIFFSLINPRNTEKLENFPKTSLISATEK